MELDAGGPLLEASEYSKRHAVSAGQLLENECMYYNESACNFSAEITCSLRKIHAADNFLLGHFWLEMAAAFWSWQSGAAFELLDGLE